MVDRIADIIAKYTKGRKYTAPKHDPNPARQYTRILYFTDAHDRPDLSKDRFAWIAKHAKAIMPDYIVNGGDTLDFDSLNAHTRNETWDGKFKPNVQLDLVSFNDSLRTFKTHAPSVPLFITLGNHEARLHTYEQNNPETYGILSEAFYDLLNIYGYSVTEYRHYLTIEGVNFTHAPTGFNHKPIGGQMAARNIALNSMADVVYGHTHKREEYVAGKYGPNNPSVRAYNGGCALPHGYRMDYAQTSPTPWDYGISEINIYKGKIEGVSWISMLELEEKYGNV